MLQVCHEDNSTYPEPILFNKHSVLPHSISHSPRTSETIQRVELNKREVSEDAESIAHSID